MSMSPAIRNGRLVGLGIGLTYTAPPSPEMEGLDNDQAAVASVAPSGPVRVASVVGLRDTDRLAGLGVATVSVSASVREGALWRAVGR